MASTANFNAMLKRYQPFKLHMELLKKENWFINKVKKKTDWNGGTMEIPLQVGLGQSYKWGGLPAIANIGQQQDLMGTLTTSDLGELWGSQVWHYRDLRRHKNMEKSYLQSLPQQMKQFSEDMSEKISLTYFGDGSITAATATGTAGGLLTVAEPWRLSIGMEIVVDDGDSASATGYITAIDRNTKVITVKDARSGGSAVDLSAYTVPQSAKVYLPGYGSEPAGLRSILLSATNGGDSSYFGLTKATYPVLQSINIDGSGFERATLLDDLYDAFYTVLAEGKGSADKVMVLPLNFLAIIGSQLDNNKRYTSETKKTAVGFREIELTGPDGVMKMVFIRDCAKTEVMILDFNAMYLCGIDFFNRHKDPDGNEFYVVRTDGDAYKYVADTCFEAALAVMPSHQGIIHSIPNPLV